MCTRSVLRRLVTSAYYSIRLIPPESFSKQNRAISQIISAFAGPPAFPALFRKSRFEEIAGLNDLVAQALLQGLPVLDAVLESHHGHLIAVMGNVRLYYYSLMVSYYKDLQCLRFTTCNVLRCALHYM